jgi:hypothetical protein
LNRWLNQDLQQTTDDGTVTLFHPDLEQSFHSIEGAKFEAHELYVKRSGFVEKVKSSPTRVLDVGLGLSYNASASIAAWLETEDPKSVWIDSLEIDSELVECYGKQEIPWTKGWASNWLTGIQSLQTSRLNEKGPALTCSLLHPLSKATLIWQVYLCDGSTLDFSHLGGAYDFVWQDPFSPDKNPELWSKEWFTKIKNVMNDDGVLVTYSVARLVKENLSSAGWTYQKMETPGRKRHWLKASPR